MFVRKGTTVRRGRRSVKRPRPPPGASSTGPPVGRHSLTLDPEAGSDSRKATPGEAGEHRPSTSTILTSSGSLTSSLPIVDDERSLCRSTSGLSDDKFQQTVSYGSILYQLKEVQDEAVDVCDFLQRFFEITWNSLTLTVFMLLLLGLPIAMIAVGSSYDHECPREPRIPIYLLVGGALGPLRSSSSCGSRRNLGTSPARAMTLPRTTTTSTTA
ncbi:uncharacterized protein LOC112560423 [Pomacea canaliculata]|uniref:uncharacterized protein LOC112560423 n=1 Tax=Pomacea canaliculata TaxID=400727 RepID=UPI000D729F54|nr:uncharacterized protein LOC112560423 [Pomacea canaliculata]